MLARTFERRPCLFQEHLESIFEELEMMVEYETLVTADLGIAGIYGDIIFIIFTF